MALSGAHAADGSPVVVYAFGPSRGEPEIVHTAIPPEAEILELGCGAGRMTHRLLELGHPVVGVDQSPDMLAYVKRAHKVLADIETLDLGRTFPVVLLASNLINTPDQEQRAAFLLTCRRHVQRDGVVIIERDDPDMAMNPHEGEVTEQDGWRFWLHHARVKGTLVSAEMHYEHEGRDWTHSFTTQVLDDDEIGGELRAAGLQLDRWLDLRRTWLAARPSSSE